MGNKNPSAKSRKVPTTRLEDLPRLNDEDREAAESGYVVVAGVPMGVDLSSLIQTFEELGRGTVADSDEVLACLKELQQRRAAGQEEGLPPVGDEPADRPPHFFNRLTDKPFKGFPVPAACPFCKAIDGGIERDSDTRSFRVECPECCSQGPIAASALQAAQKWNAAAAARPSVHTPDDDEPSGSDAADLILAGLAILDLYTDAVPDARAKERYVLWACRDKFEEACEIAQALPGAVRA